MRISSFREFLKATQRTRLLYEVTMQSYDALYESGRKILRDPLRRDEKLEFVVAGQTVKRPLKVVTYHSRDVYPELLRATLLVRIVAAFEAFLVDSVEEISIRSKSPFLTDSRLDFSQEQLITIEAQGGIYGFIVQKTLRALTSGGLKEIRKFYRTKLRIELTSSEAEFKKITEIHDRRHVLVHRLGYADASYVAKYKSSQVREGQLLEVPETYFVDSIKALQAVPSHIKRCIETLYPEPPTRVYVKGMFDLNVGVEHLVLISFDVTNPDGTLGISDLSLPIGSSSTLKDLTCWQSFDGREMRLLLAADASQARAFRKELRQRELGNLIAKVRSIKLQR